MRKWERGMNAQREKGEWVVGGRKGGGEGLINAFLGSAGGGWLHVGRLSLYHSLTAFFLFFIGIYL